MSSFALERLSEILFRDVTPRRRLAVFGLAVGCTAAIGIIDFSIGYHISLLAFYFFPLSMAVVALGWRAGLAISVLAVSGWLVGDHAVGRYRTSTTFVAAWNASIVFITFLSISSLLAALLAAYRKMDEKVKLRTEALRREVAERARLEMEILEISESERRKVGHDLHDGLGQHLTGTAFVQAHPFGGRTAATTSSQRFLDCLMGCRSFLRRPPSTPNETPPPILSDSRRHRPFVPTVWRAPPQIPQRQCPDMPRHGCRTGSGRAPSRRNYREQGCGDRTG